jgi:ABC-type Na+ transport system ATPase subunit NatA
MEKTYLFPKHVCKSVATPLTKKIVLMSFPVTTGSFTHIAGDNMSGKDTVAPNIVK